MKSQRAEWHLRGRPMTYHVGPIAYMIHHHLKFRKRLLLPNPVTPELRGALTSFVTQTLSKGLFSLHGVILINVIDLYVSVM
jgi:hypothetical protein